MKAEKAVNENSNMSGVGERQRKCWRTMVGQFVRAVIVPGVVPGEVGDGHHGMTVPVPGKAVEIPIR